MARFEEPHLNIDALLYTAGLMVAAARTAPKGRGVDNIQMFVISGEEIGLLAQKLKAMGEELDNSIFLRDARNLLQAELLLLIGTRYKSLGLKDCGLCGFDNCEEKNKHPLMPCVFNTTDIGIAIGSAVSVAMEHRVDNRIMYSVGYAALRAGLFTEDIKLAYGIPLSISSKNPFFDRK